MVDWQHSITIKHSSNSNPDRLLLFNRATGIEESIPADGIEIYSFENQVFIKADEPGEVEVTVYNLLGQSILHRTLTGLKTLSEFKTDKPGFYLVLVRTNKAMKVKKVYIR